MTDADAARDRVTVEFEHAGATWTGIEAPAAGCEAWIATTDPVPVER